MLALSVNWSRYWRLLGCNRCLMTVYAGFVEGRKKAGCQNGRGGFVWSDRDTCSSKFFDSFNQEVFL